MKPSASNFHDIRGLRYHVRTWGRPSSPRLVMLHGWMDVSASFQFLVDALQRDWYVIAPDWRGFGLTEWARGYWFPDYYADLDALLDIYSPGEAVNLLGHSMGGNVACTYTGIRPDRVARLISLEGFGYIRMGPELAPARYGKWLDEIKSPPTMRPYATLDEVAARMMKKNPRLTLGRARFLAGHWASANAAGEFVLRADPRHKMSNPVLNRLEEHMACWAYATAPALWVLGRQSDVTGWKKDTPGQIAQRKAAFKNLRECEIDGAGHMMHHDQPERLARIVEDFLAE
jgi:pimeloyl-ACP methyl ester carboxylesterase